MRVQWEKGARTIGCAARLGSPGRASAKFESVEAWSAKEEAHRAASRPYGGFLYRSTHLHLFAGLQTTRKLAAKHNLRFNVAGWVDIMKPAAKLQIAVATIGFAGAIAAAIITVHWSDKPSYSITCAFNVGPQAGKFGKSIVPAYIGSPCADRDGNYGYAIQDVPQVINPAQPANHQPTRPETSTARKTVVVCHGEYKQECDAHPYDVFEHCGNDNGVGGADPRISGPRYCGNPNYTVLPAAGGSIGGNHCGYSWFKIVCM